MGFQWMNGDLKTMVTELRSIPEEVASEVQTLVSEAMNIGAETQRHVIENSGTPKSGKRGRIETGLMRNSVQSAGADRVGNTIEGKFGWRDPEPYFLYQEQGFTINSRKSEYTSRADVPAMHALLQGFVKAREHVRAGLLRMLR